jgi:hypothetical protein
MSAYQSICCVSMSMAIMLQAAPVGAQGESTPDVHLSLKGKPEEIAGLQLIGPDAEKCVHFEPDGLRINLPAGYAGERPNTGIRTSVAVKGDFEILVNFEVLAEPETADAGKRATKLTLLAILGNPHATNVGLSRRVAASDGLQFSTWLTLKNPDTGKNQQKFRVFPTDIKKGRLRLARTGGLATYSMARTTDREDTFLHEFPVGDETLQAVTLAGSTGGPKAKLDVRFTDLRIRAGAVQKATPVAINEKVAGKWLVRALSVSLLITAVLGGIWFLARKSRPGHAEVPVESQGGER